MPIVFGGGRRGSIDRPLFQPAPDLDKIPSEVNQEVVKLALEYPNLFSRQIAWLFTG
jgi:hypothetical protein